MKHPGLSPFTLSDNHSLSYHQEERNVKTKKVMREKKKKGRKFKIEHLENGKKLLMKLRLSLQLPVYLILGFLPYTKIKDTFFNQLFSG